MKPVFGDTHSMHCTYCKTNLSIRTKGVTTVKDHVTTEKHKKHAAPYAGQSEFNANGSLPNLQTLKSHLTPQDMITRAEIIEALNTVECNRSFQSANNDSKRYKVMFQNDPVAQGYSQGETKMKYNIQFGLAPYIKQKLKSDCVDKPFVFLFDETTTSQGKKQYDGYIRFFSFIKNQIETHYCGSLFVGHCTAVDLLDHFNHFMGEMGLDLHYLLNLGLDGPRVNEKFINDLKNELEAKAGTTFLDIGTCNLHAVNNGFGKGLQLFKDEEIIDLDQFAIDLHFFFKLSAARREDYAKTAELSEITAVYMMKHVQTRWLSIEKVLVRIMEQFKNLKIYFLETLPKQKKFKREIAKPSKPGIPNRYQRIANLLKSATTIAYMGFVVHTTVPFKRFVLTFQTNEPMVHLLYDEMLRLVKSVLGMFIDAKKIPSKRSELLKKNCSYEKLHKAKCDVGTKASSMVRKLDDAFEAKKFYGNAKKFLICCAVYLLKNLPLDQQILIDVQVLHPTYKLMKNGTNAIKRLALEVTRVLGKKANDAFKHRGEDYQLIDVILKEFNDYTLHMIPESFYKKQNEESKKENSRQQYSYWSEAFKAAGVENIQNVSSEYTRIDHYWDKVEGLLDSSGKKMFPHLCALAKCLLLLSHGNADPERGFSLNKHLLATHGSTTDEDTIVAIRLVKDFIVHNGGTNNVVITKEMIASSNSAWSRYELFLQRKRDEECARKAQLEKEAKEKQAAEDQSEKAKKRDEEKEQILSDIAMFGNYLQLSEKTIVSANEEMRKLLNSGTLVKKDIQLCQAKSEMAIKRKQESETGIASLKKKLSKLSKD